jgi:hypothetical protein
MYLTYMEIIQFGIIKKAWLHLLIYFQSERIRINHLTHP